MNIIKYINMLKLYNKNKIYQNLYNILNIIYEKYEHIDEYNMTTQTSFKLHYFSWFC